MLKTGKRLKFLTRASLIVLLSSCAPTPDGGESAVYEPDSGGGRIWSRRCLGSCRRDGNTRERLL